MNRAAGSRTGQPTALRRITHLTRGLDPKRLSNRFIVALTALTAISGLGLGYGAFVALRAAGAVFFTWALGRELDPDRTWTAAIAATVMAILAQLAPVSLGATAVLMLAARVLVRSTGLAPTWIDRIWVTGLAVLFADTTAGWAAGLALAFALHRDGAFSVPHQRSWTVFAVGAAALVTVVAWPEAFAGPWMPPDVYWGALAAMGLVAGVTLPNEAPESRADVTKEPLDPARLRSSRWITLAALVLAVLAGGGPAIQATSPAWVVLVTTWVGARSAGWGGGKFSMKRQ